MKRTIQNSLLLVIVLVTVSQLAIAQDPITEDKQGIQFFKGSWDEALAKAKKTKKLLFIDAYATWCGPCKMMDKNVFTKKEVGDYYNKNFIPVKIDVDSTTGRPIASKYKVTAMPTYLFVDGEGKLVYKKLGYMKPTEFIEVGKSALEIPALHEKFAKGDRSKEFLTKYLAAVDNAEASVAKNYFKKVTDKELLYDKNVFKIMTSYTRDPESREFKYFLAHTQDFKDEYGNRAINVAVGILDNLYEQSFKQKDTKALQQLFSVLRKLDPVMPKTKSEKIIEKLQKQFDKKK
ncbi:thioredoxin family protein [Microscilla marina]|uniref:Putative disulphide-isomerase n=1 Tax=Microscilla marina ATCC 23134 TaxID=313606 RepID=A1ZNU8_MICM2|nr:thioredoxin family protein [Microscilla marina]EAY27987.1 putative disulphide-isomerase [Microscilla marina ATCC 23134]